MHYYYLVFSKWNTHFVKTLFNILPFWFLSKRLSQKQKVVKSMHACITCHEGLRKESGRSRWYVMQRLTNKWFFLRSILRGPEHFPLLWIVKRVSHAFFFFFWDKCVFPMLRVGNFFHVSLICPNAIRLSA